MSNVIPQTSQSKLPSEAIIENEITSSEVLNRSTSLLSYDTVKRAMDIAGAFALIMLLAPAFVYIMLNIRKSGKRIFFGHKRIGRDGKEFICYKFRTMVENADELLKELLANNPKLRKEWDQHYKLKYDPRVTEIGAVLRKYSLDELPQLWNVLKGDMSLVGPRPVIREELIYYTNFVDYYKSVRPGLTGLWQVSGRSDTGYEKRVVLDANYVQNRSFLLDISVLFKTALVVIKGDGAY
jgi:undecaprenyl-phosphate galactose phosphotransferase